MARSAAAPSHIGALDDKGVTTVLSNPGSGDSPLTGAAYLNSGVLAAVPVWLHSLQDGTFLWVNKEEIYSGTPVKGKPSYYTSTRIRTGAMWHRLNPANGQVSAVTGYPTTVPLDTPADTAVVVAGASRNPHFMFLLNSAESGSQTFAILQLFQTSPHAGIHPLLEEAIQPVKLRSGAVVNFTSGLRYAQPFIYVYGTDSVSNVYAMRKSWSAIGATKPIRTTYPRTAFQEVIASSTDWTYYGSAQGFGEDSADMTPLLASSGASMTTAGPLGFATAPRRLLTTVVSSAAGSYSAQAYSGYVSRPATLSGPLVPLGGPTGYVGAGLPVMSSLTSNPNSGLAVTTALALATEKIESGDALSFRNSWIPLTV